MAGGDGRVWAIAGEGDVTFWRDDEGAFVPLSYIGCYCEVRSCERPIMFLAPSIP